MTANAICARVADPPTATAGITATAMPATTTPMVVSGRMVVSTSGPKIARPNSTVPMMNIASSTPIAPGPRTGSSTSWPTPIASSAQPHHQPRAMPSRRQRRMQPIPPMSARVDATASSSTSAVGERCTVTCGATRIHAIAASEQRDRRRPDRDHEPGDAASVRPAVRARRRRRRFAAPWVRAGPLVLPGLCLRGHRRLGART